MRSKLAILNQQAQHMTPTERIELVDRITEEWITNFMAAQGVDRRAAKTFLRRMRRAGRQPSACMDGRRYD